MSELPRFPGFHFRPGPGGTNEYIGTVAGPPLEPELRRALESATRQFALSVNCLDAALLEPHLAESVALWTQSREFPRQEGRAAVVAFLSLGFDDLRQHNPGRTHAEMGVVGMPEGADYPCAIQYYDDRRIGLAILQLDASGLISDIGLLKIPRPSEATGLGDVPRTAT